MSGSIRNSPHWDNRAAGADLSPIRFDPAGCPQIQAMLAAGMGRLSEEEVDVVIGHVEACAACRSRLDVLCPADTALPETNPCAPTSTDPSWANSADARAAARNIESLEARILGDVVERFERALSAMRLEPIVIAGPKVSAIRINAEPGVPSWAPTDDEIRTYAYYLYVERGGTPGHALDDWLRAERELTEQRQAAMLRHHALNGQSRLAVSDGVSSPACLTLDDRSASPRSVGRIRKS